MSKEEKKDFKYDAFISYRHAPLDIYVAETLQKELESFKVPGIANKDIKKLGKDGIKRIFRDKDELPLAGNLSEPITYALENSEYLIVICSPRTPESMWVQREIQTFAELRGIENIFAVLIEGEPKDAFPQQLTCIQQEVTLPDGTKEMQEQQVEPLAADVRGETKSIVHKKIKNEIFRLAAPMLGCSYDDLKQRHKMRRLKRLLITCSIAGAICLGFGTFSTVQAIRIHQQAQELEIKNNKNLELQSKSLSAQALDLYDQGNKLDSLLVSLAGTPKNAEKPDRPITADSIHSLSQILQVYTNHTEFLPYHVLEQDTMINKAVMTGDGTKIVSIDDMGQLYSWDMESGKMLAKVQSNDGIVSDNLYAIGDNTIICGDYHNIKCFQADNLEILWNIDNNDNGMIFMTISTDQSMMAFNDSNKIHIIRTDDGKEISSWNIEDSINSTGYNMTFSDDNKLLLYEMPSLEDGTGRVCATDINTGLCKAVYSMKYQMLNAVRYTKQGECYIACMSADQFSDTGFNAMQSLECYNADGTLRWEKTGMSSIAKSLSFYNDWFVYADGESIVMISQETGETQKEFHYPCRVTKYVASPENDTIVACLIDGTISSHLVSMDNDFSVDFMKPANELISTIFRNRDLIVRVPRASSNIYVFKNVTGSKMEDLGELSNSDISGIVTSDGSRLISYGNSFLQMYDLKNKNVLKYDEFEGIVLDGCLVDDEQKLLLVLNKSILLYDIRTGEVLDSITKDIHYQYMDLKNNQLTILTFDEELITYNMDTLEEVGKLKNDSYVSSFITMGDGKEIIGLTYDKAILIDTSNGKTEELPWKSEFIAASCDGESYLIADETTKKVSLYKGTSKEPINSIECKISYLNRIEFSSDGTKFFVLLQDGHLEIYDTQTFDRLGVLENMKNIDSLYTDGTIQVLHNSQFTDTAYLLDKDMNLLYELPDFMGITKDKTVFYTSSYKELMSCPIYDLSMLLDEANQVLDGRSLDADKAVQYYIK